MMKLAKVFCFLVALGGLAFAASAQTATSSSSDAGDPKIVFPDACPTNAYCATITAGSSAISIGACDSLTPILTLAANPTACGDGNYLLLSTPAPVPVSLSYFFTCGSDTSPDPMSPTGEDGFQQFAPNGSLLPPATFTGCAFADGYIPAGASISIAVEGPNGNPPPNAVTLVIPNGFVDADEQITLSPEPGTFVLFMSGLLLIFLGGFARKRFGATSVN